MPGKRTPFSPGRLLEVLAGFDVSGVYWVAYSGGADSTALLQALHELHEELEAPVRAFHVNHGLHTHCDAWQSHCERFCEARQIPLKCVSVELDRKAGTGLEAEARRQRYAAAQELLQAGDVLLTAHHSDDQAETVLLNLMRGSGVDGLAGMPRMRPLGKGRLARPLLTFNGASLQTYLLGKNIGWIEDESNLDESYDRNFLRSRLMPVLEKRWDRAADKIALSASHCREASRLLGDMADADLSVRLTHPRILEVDKLAETEPARLKILLRRWLKLNSATSLPTRRLEELLRQLRLASGEHHVKVAWDDWVVQLYRRQLWLQKADSIAACPEAEWRGTRPLDLGPVSGRLEITPPGTEMPVLHAAPRRGGERIHLPDSNGHRSIKHLLQRACVPPWLRASIPMLSLDGEVQALGDWAIGSRLRQWLEQSNAILRWTPADPLLDYVRINCRPKSG